MYLPDFRYQRPTSVAEAVQVLAEHGRDARVYMGGTQLLLSMKLGHAAPGCLVDGKHIEGLDEISVHDGRLFIGAAVTLRQIEHSAAIRRVLPSLCDLTARIGNLRVRAAGTLGGSLCSADPQSDPATLLIALGARLQVAAARGQREIGCADFIRGPYQTALRDDELVTGVSVPLPGEATRVAYERIALPRRPVVNVALVRSGIGVRVVAAGGGRAPRRIGRAEALLADGPDAAAEAADVTAIELDPGEDIDGSAAYKRQLVRVLFRRAADRLTA
jgi:carbon-monoxide dehydrogenase medium subunit